MLVNVLLNAITSMMLSTRFKYRNQVNFSYVVSTMLEEHVLRRFYWYYFDFSGGGLFFVTRLFFYGYRR